MDNIKIEIIGSGVKLTGGKLSNIQVGYILSNQTECHTVIPLFNDDHTFTYKNWLDINDLCNTYGSSYKSGSEIFLSVNNVVTKLTNFNEERNIINVDNDTNYIVSMRHLQGNILTFEFNVENYDENKLTFIVDDLNSLLWGEIIYGIKYNGQVQDNVLTETTDMQFETFIFNNNNITPIQNNINF
jgi:hypothetical protein